MKRILSLMLCSAVLLSAVSCVKPEGNNEETVNWTDVPVVTQSADESVTAGPTATPENSSKANEEAGLTEDSATDVPVITQSPDGQVTEGPTATPYTAALDSAKPTNTAAGTESASPAPTAAAVTPKPGEPTNKPTNKPTEKPGTPKPTAAPGNTTSPTQGSQPSVPKPDVPNDFEAVYTGGEVDCSNLKVGDTFLWSFDLSNEKSCLYAGHWLVMYPDEYIEPVACYDARDGSLVAKINETWDDDEPWSDVPRVVYNINYEGMTGNVPYGMAGKHYTVVALFLTSFEYGGVQMSGSIITIKYKVKALPKEKDLNKDSKGSYLPLEITVMESVAMVSATGGVTHGSITVTPGKLYFKH